MKLELSGQAEAVLIAVYSRSKATQQDVQQDSLMDITGLPRHQVVGALAELIELGFVTDDPDEPNGLIPGPDDAGDAA